MAEPRTIRLEDYAVPPFLVDRVDLRVEVDEASVLVKSTLSLRRNPESNDRDAPLKLDGDDLELLGIELDGVPLGEGTYTVSGEQLSIAEMPDSTTLTVHTRIYPEENTKLEGLYKAESAYCTQCEAEGFRRITFFPDRPDVMAIYSTTIVADRQRCPVMLSNGNPVARGDTDDGRHWITWEDPYPKPSYLFALVAGDLACIEDVFTTASGRDVRLRIYVEQHNLDKCDHAMTALKKSMAWDEEVYGLEYDLDLYMIVAVDDFNMGAMENKGLNVFNSKYVLARPDTATDTDFANIEAVIAHEYFHNWTGNRVTCRDWFQLSLKEGLTVFRDQQFSADQGSPAVKRIQDVRILRTAQFAEDAGPMAHPVRPDSYMEINNFYTVTIYNKGAEVIRMIHTLLGREKFRAGMDLYFERHDGQAVTTEDFVSAMEDASGISLSQFRRWYFQAGTPEVTISPDFDAQSGTLTVRAEQACPATPGQSAKLPFHIPLNLGLVGTSTDGSDSLPAAETNALALTEAAQTFEFSGLSAAPVISVPRNFSAPIKVKLKRSNDELAHLLGADPDPFCRWDAGQTLLLDTLVSNIERYGDNAPMQVSGALVDALRSTLEDTTLDLAFVAEVLTLPSVTYVAEQISSVNIEALEASSRFLRSQLANGLTDTLHDIYETTATTQIYAFTPGEAGRRALRNTVLDLLIEAESVDVAALATQQFANADNMTDSIASLRVLANLDCSERLDTLAAFEEQWKHDSLVMDKWLTVQATSALEGTLSEVEALLAHESFDLKKPNKVRALIGAFCHGNPLRFHATSGVGYEFLTDQIAELDTLNPQIAARLLSVLGRWRRFSDPNQALMHKALERIAQMDGLSRDCHEVVSKTLASPPITQ